MKKLMIFALIACLALLVSGSIFATNIEGGVITTSTTNTVHESVNLKAFVGPYAVIKFTSSPDSLWFTGYKNEKRDGRVFYSIETNCDASVRGIGSKFTKKYQGKDYSINTWYSTYPSDSGKVDYVPAGASDTDVKDVAYPFGISGGVIDYYGVLGEVSAQPAGSYNATYTLYVYNPQHVD
jgi:hypothetical protein